MTQRADTTICLYGDTGSGKTTLLGELAEDLFRAGRGRTRLATADLGGTKGIEPLISAGIIEVVPLSGDPWIWLHRVAGGAVPDPSRPGKWIDGDPTGVAMFAFESVSALGEVFIEDLRQRAARGENIGGGGSYAITVVEDKEALKIGANNQTHYNVVQQQLYEEITRSQALPCDVLLWTTACERGVDESKSPIVGPAVAGRAMTSKVPRWFQYTFRAAAIPQTGKPPIHRLYLDSHIDPTTGGMVGIANARVPLRGASVKVPPYIEPSSLVGALDILRRRHAAALKEVAPAGAGSPA